MKIVHTLTLSKGIGHIAFMALRDAVESAMAGSLEPGETLASEVMSDREANFTIETDRDVGDREAQMWAETIKEHVAACLEPGETMTVERVADETAPRP